MESLNSLDLAASHAANVTVLILVLVSVFALVLGAESEAGTRLKNFSELRWRRFWKLGAIGARTRDRLRLRQL